MRGIEKILSYLQFSRDLNRTCPTMIVWKYINTTHEQGPGGLRGRHLIGAHRARRFMMVGSRPRQNYKATLAKIYRTLYFFGLRSSYVHFVLGYYVTSVSHRLPHRTFSVPGCEARASDKQSRTIISQLWVP